MNIDARRTQQKLRDAGYYTGAIDGLFYSASWTALLCCVAQRRTATEQDRALGRSMFQSVELYNITTPLRISHFLAQTAVESGGFVRLTESLTYTTAGRIRAVWPSRFPTIASAQPFVRNPQGLANKVYMGRMGNTVEGDGWRFRGRGLIQLTGRDNYREAEGYTGLALASDPGLAANPENAGKIAAGYWRNRNLNPLADQDQLTAIRKKVNGGTHGLDSARVFLGRAKAVLL